MLQVRVLLHITVVGRLIKVYVKSTLLGYTED